MAYVTGTAGSMSDLLTALKNACVANGWTLSGDVLHKGTCYARVTTSNLNDAAAPANSKVEVLVGNGIDAGNLLLDTPATSAGFGILCDRLDDTYIDWDWPVTYRCHVLTDPDEVYFVVSYDAGQYWQWLGFGQSPSPGNAGTGNWQSASQARGYGVRIYADRCALELTGGSYYSGTSNGNFVPGPFFLKKVWNQSQRIVNGDCIHGAIDDNSGLPAWSRGDYGYDDGGTDAQVIERSPQVTSGYSNTPLLEYTPNAFNQELVLFPARILQRRPSDKVSVVGEMQHLRLCRNEYVDPGAVVTRGAEQWTVYPMYRKNPDAPVPTDVGRVSGSLQSHSGTLAMAIRYDGP